MQSGYDVLHLVARDGPSAEESPAVLVVSVVGRRRLPGAVPDARFPLPPRHLQDPLALGGAQGGSRSAGDRRPDQALNHVVNFHLASDRLRLLRLPRDVGHRRRRVAGHVIAVAVVVVGIRFATTGSAVVVGIRSPEIRRGVSAMKGSGEFRSIRCRTAVYCRLPARCRCTAQCRGRTYCSWPTRARRTALCRCPACRLTA